MDTRLQSRLVRDIGGVSECFISPRCDFPDRFNRRFRAIRESDSALCSWIMDRTVTIQMRASIVRTS